MSGRRTTGIDARMESALKHFLTPMSGLDFDVIVKALTGFDVLPLDGESPEGGAFLGSLERLCGTVMRDIHADPIIRPRPNEVGNDAEKYFVNAEIEAGATCAFAKTASGKGKMSAYPDLRFERDGAVAYLEVKTYAAHKDHSSFRAFYLSPSEDFKVAEDAHHLVVGLAMEAGETSEPGKLAYTPVSASIVDLSDLRCNVKYEFNASNRDLYGDDARVLAVVDHGAGAQA